MFTWIAIAGAGDEIYLFTQAAAVMLHNNRQSLGQRCDIRCSTAAGQAHGRPFPVADGGRVQVAVAINLRAANKAQLHFSRGH